MSAANFTTGYSHCAVPIFTKISRSEVSNGVTINPSFFWLDLRHPDKLYIYPFSRSDPAGLSLMIAPV